MIVFGLKEPRSWISWKNMRRMAIWRVVSLQFRRWVGKDLGGKLHMFCERVIREAMRVAGDMPSQV